VHGWGPPGAPASRFAVDPYAALRSFVPTGPDAPLQARYVARGIDLVVEAVLVGFAAAVAPAGRHLAIGLIAFLFITAYETVSVARWGATLGKRARHLMVVPVGRAGAVPWRSALQRGAAIGSIALAAFASPGAGIAIAIYLGVSAAAAQHHRAGHDRVAETYVVVAEQRPREVTTEQLEHWFDPKHARVWSRLGLVATMYDRRRARARRLEHAPWLLAYLVASSLALVTIWQSVVAVVLLSLAWIVVFTIDESIRIHRTGTTYGHCAYGLVVIDRRTGRPPGWGRSIARAAVLGLFMFTPLMPVLALWIKVADEGRGPHDRAGKTAVITHPALSERFAAWPVAPTVPMYRF
jgi:hypothetical protein